MRLRSIASATILAAVVGCKGSSRPAPDRTPPAAAIERPTAERATVVREEASAQGEVRLYAGGVADLDGDGALELVAGGFSTVDGGRRSTVRVYRRSGDDWAPLAEAGWDGGAGSMVRNVEIADVDGDGRLDVVALGRVGATPHDAEARLAIFALRDGALVTQAEVDWRSGVYTHGYGLALGDLDGDGRTDLATGGFQFDGTREVGVVRVWSYGAGALTLRAETTLDGAGAAAMRINDLAIGDVDGDGAAELIAAGRRGALKSEELRAHHELRRELGDLSVLAFRDGALATRARYAWGKGTSLRVRSVVAADLDGDRRADIVAGGQYDADGKAALGLFGFERGELALRHDASSTAEGVPGEVKDLVVDGARVLVTGDSGDRPRRAGVVGVWHLERGALVRDANVTSRNGDDTRARAAVVVPGAAGSTILTIGHAQQPRRSMIGQVLAWSVDAPAPTSTR